MGEGIGERVGMVRWVVTFVSAIAMPHGAVRNTFQLNSIRRSFLRSATLWTSRAVVTGGFPCPSGMNICFIFVAYMLRSVFPLLVGFQFFVFSGSRFRPVGCFSLAR